MPEVECLPTVKEWCDFVRRVTFHKNNPTKDMEACLLPSYTALERHVLRATYVLKLVFSVSASNCPVLNDCFSLGWIKGTNDAIEINWDDSNVVDSFVSSYVTCGCRTGCGTKRCKCFSSNNLCNVRCKCTNCKNTRDSTTCSPNSVGASVSANIASDSICQVESDTDGDASEDEQIVEGEDFDVQLYVDNCI